MHQSALRVIGVIATGHSGNKHNSRAQGNSKQEEDAVLGHTNKDGCLYMDLGL